MDAVKNQLIKLKTDIPDCTATRQRLRSILSDYFPTEKQLINAILNAYDEDVENRLKASSDRTLSAFQLIKVLKNDYGMTDSSAFVAIESWCYILGYFDVADALSDVITSRQQATTEDSVSSTQSTVDLGLGIYKAGVDFPAGELSLQIVGDNTLCVFYGISKNPNRINDDKNFMDKTYVDIKDGQYLKLHSFETNPKFVIRVAKIS